MAEQLGLSAEDVQLDASFADDLGADDLDRIELMMAFEEEFDVELDEDDAENLRTVQNVVEFVSHRTQ